MAKGGRKRKFDVKRKPSGDVKVKSMSANPVVLAQRLAAAKDIRADAGDPLSVLFHRGVLADKDADGKISDDGRNLFSVGSEFGARYWRLFGKPFGKSMDPNAVRGIDAVDPVKAMQDEKAYDQAIHALDRLGRNTRRIVLDCCAHHQWTPSAHHVERLKLGLEALYDLPRPRISEGQRDRAREEMAA